MYIAKLHCRSVHSIRYHEQYGAFVYIQLAQFMPSVLWTVNKELHSERMNM